MINQTLFTLVTILTIIAVILCYLNITEEKITLKFKTIITLIVCIGITVFLNYVDIIALKTIFSLISFYLILVSVSAKPKVEVFYYAVLIWLYGMLLDVLIMLFTSIPSVYDQLIKLDYTIIQTIGGTLMSGILYGTSKFRLFRKLISKIIKALNKIKPNILAEFAYVSIIIFINAICVINLNKLSIQLYAVIILILVFFLVINVITNNYNVRKTKEINNILMKNNDFFLNVLNDYRIIKHNLTSKLLGIKTVSNDSAKKLIDELILEYNSKFLSINDLNKIPSGINGLIYEKFYNFNSQNIHLAVENSVTKDLLNLIKPKTYNEMCEVLGVIIDNALDAANSSEEKAILIDFTETKECIIIKVVNTFSNTIDIDNIGEVNVSSKGKNHGIGLFSVFKQKNVKVKNKIYGNLFESNIKIKKALIN